MLGLLFPTLAGRTCWNSLFLTAHVGRGCLNPSTSSPTFVHNVGVRYVTLSEEAWILMHKSSFRPYRHVCVLKPPPFPCTRKIIYGALSEIPQLFPPTYVGGFWCFLFSHTHICRRMAGFMEVSVTTQSHSAWFVKILSSLAHIGHGFECRPFQKPYDDICRYVARTHSLTDARIFADTSRHS